MKVLQMATLVGIVALLITLGSPNVGVPNVLAVGQDWDNAPMAIPSDGWVHKLWEGVYPLHNGIDIWTNQNSNGSGRGNPVYLPHSGKLVSKVLDNNGKNIVYAGLIFEHEIDAVYSSHLPKDSDGDPILHVWTFYWHMADEDSATSYINSDLQVGQMYDAGTYLGDQGNRKMLGDKVVHLHLTVSKSNSESETLDPTPYLGPDFSVPRTIDDPYWVSYNGPPLWLGGSFLFKDARYNGSWLRFDSNGLHNIPSWFDNQASSIKVPQDGLVKVYKHANAIDPSRTLTQNDPDFNIRTFDNGEPLNDAISSLKIDRAPPI